MINIGASGLGKVKEAVINLERMHDAGLKCCEIAFTYSIYIKEFETPVIREAAKRLGIRLSIHAPYWINLNSSDPEKIEASKKRILDCCKIGELLGAETIVFHPGFYGKRDKEESYEIIKKAINEIMDEIKKNKWKIKIAPETTGKKNVFGSIDEILRLVKDTGCFFTIDFSHLMARVEGKTSYEEIFEHFKQFSRLHCHFSGIEWGKMGEKRHIPTPDKEIRNLLQVLDKNKDITLINEAPDTFGDAVKMNKILEELK